MGSPKTWQLWCLAGVKVAAFGLFVWLYAGKFFQAAVQLSEPPSLEWSWLGLSLALVVAGHLGLPSGLHFLCRGLRPTQAASLYLVSSPTKYVPGKVWPTLVFTGLGSRFGLRVAESLALVFWLNVGVVLSALVVGSGAVSPALALAMFFLALALPCALPVRAAWLQGIKRRLVHTNFPGRFAFLRALVSLTAYWALQGLGFCCLIRGLGFHLEVSSFLEVTSALAVCALLGILAPFAPGGLGVREVVLSHYLSSLLPGVEPILAPAFIRIFQMSIEGMGMIVGLMLLRRCRLHEETGVV